MADPASVAPDASLDAANGVEDGSRRTIAASCPSPPVAQPSGMPNALPAPLGSAPSFLPNVPSLLNMPLDSDDVVAPVATQRRAKAHWRAGGAAVTVAGLLGGKHGVATGGCEGGLGDGDSDWSAAILAHTSRPKKVRKRRAGISRRALPKRLHVSSCVVLKERLS